MSSSHFLDPDEVRRQVQAYVQSLRAAGIEWSPLGPPLHWASKPNEQTVANMTVPAPVGLELSTTSSTNPIPPRDADNLQQRRQELVLLAKEVAKCTLCPALASTRTQTVFGQGEPGVDLCFVGEAPGADEDAQGIPFVGAAGQLLNKIIQACGLKREEIYICNILKCRPPGNRTPQPNEADNCRGFLTRQIEWVRPKYIVALGGCAATNLLNTTESLGRLRGKFHDYHGIPLMVTYHPSYLLPHRNPEKKREVWNDMKWLMAKMGRTLPKDSKS